MKKVVLTIAAFLFVTGVTMAQDNNDTNEASHQVKITVPTVALVDVEGADGEASIITLSPSVDNLEAGEAVNFGSATDNSLWLNYTSIVGANGPNQNTRKVSAELTGSGSLPDGVNLLLTVGAASTGTGNGKLGQSAATDLILTGSPQDVVTGIGTCYTGTGDNNGHQLTYSLGVNNSNYEDITADDYTVTVQYTISN